MKRAGFTMIELIFVIVVLGILAAVALPKFIGVSEQAEAAKCEALVGTLNRTVGPTMWSQSMMEGDSGALLTTFTNAAGIANEIARQIDIPTECSYTNAYGENGTVTIGDKTYDVNFTDGNTSSAPTWGWNPQ